MGSFYCRISFNFIVFCIVSYTFHVRPVVSTDFKMEKQLNDIKYITNSCSYFSSNLFKTLTLEKTTENIVNSPFSVYILLSILLSGAGGTTKEELKSVLHLLNLDYSENGLKNLLSILNTTDKIKLDIANAMFINNELLISENFLMENKKNFQTLIKKLNFKNNLNSAEIMNNWVKEKTRGKISSIIESNDIDSYTRIILLNAVYFKSSWLNQFEKELTEEKKFYNIDKTESLVSTMSQRFNVPHGRIESINANFIKMKYFNEEFEMIIILPNERYGLCEIESKFDWNVISKATYATKDVDLLLPKFKIEAKLDLKAASEELGVKSVFNEKANFSLISDEPLHVSEALQKIFLKVDEQGSEAAVMTAAQIRSRRMILDEEYFIVDHPFMFVIHHEPSSIPLFVGTVRKLGKLIVKEEL